MCFPFCINVDQGGYWLCFYVFLSHRMCNFVVTIGDSCWWYRPWSATKALWEWDGSGLLPKTWRYQGHMSAMGEAGDGLRSPLMLVKTHWAGTWSWKNDIQTCVVLVNCMKLLVGPNLKNGRQLFPIKNQQFWMASLGCPHFRKPHLDQLPSFWQLNHRKPMNH